MLARVLYHTIRSVLTIDGIDIDMVPDVSARNKLTEHMIDVKLIDGDSKISKLAFLLFYNISSVPDNFPRGQLDFPFTLQEFDDYTKIFYWGKTCNLYPSMLRNYFRVTDFLMPKTDELYFFNGWNLDSVWEFVDANIDEPFMPTFFLKTVFLNVQPEKYFKCLSRAFFVELFAEYMIAKDCKWNNHYIRSAFMTNNKSLFEELGYNYKELVDKDYRWHM